MACHCVHGGILPQLNVAVDRADRRRNTSACSCLAFTQAKFHCSAVGGEKKGKEKKNKSPKGCVGGEQPSSRRQTRREGLMKGLCRPPHLRRSGGELRVPTQLAAGGVVPLMAARQGTLCRRPLFPVPSIEFFRCWRGRDRLSGEHRLSPFGKPSKQSHSCSCSRLKTKEK